MYHMYRLFVLKPGSDHFCLHVDGFSRNRGQNNRVTRLFGSFVSSQVFVYEREFSRTAKQQYHFHDSSYSPSQMAEVSKAAVSCGQFALSDTIKSAVEFELPARPLTYHNAGSGCVDVGVPRDK